MASKNKTKHKHTVVPDFAVNLEIWMKTLQTSLFLFRLNNHSINFIQIHLLSGSLAVSQDSRFGRSGRCLLTAGEPMWTIIWKQSQTCQEWCSWEWQPYSVSSRRKGSRVSVWYTWMDRGKGGPDCCSVRAVWVWACTRVCLCVSAGERLTSFWCYCHYLAPALRDGVVRGGHSWSRGNSNDPQCSSLNQEVPIKTGWDHWRQQILLVTVT